MLDRWKLFRVENGCCSPISRVPGRCCKGEFGFSGITDKPDRFIRELKRHHPDARYRMEKVSLDDLFVRLVKEDEQYEA